MKTTLTQKKLHSQLQKLFRDIDNLYVDLDTAEAEEHIEFGFTFPALNIAKMALTEACKTTLPNPENAD